MGSLVLYIMEWALCLLIFLLVYKVCFSGSTFHRFNRFYLLGSVVVAAVLPMIHVCIDNSQMADINQLRIADTQFANELSSVSITHTSYPTVQPTAPSLWTVIVVLSYFVYVLLLLCGWTKSCYRMICFLKGKRQYKVGRWLRIIVHDGPYGPFSWLNCVVISRQENGFARRAGMLHEIAHVKNGHAVDLVLLLACTILNPVCWLVLKEIKIVHEYEADDDVINRYHIQKRDYQRLLIMRTVGAEAYALASSFNLNIKQRIKMMKRKQSTWWRMSCILVTLPIVGIALTAFAEPQRILAEKIDGEVDKMVASVDNSASGNNGMISCTENRAQGNSVNGKSANPTVRTDAKLKVGNRVSGKVCGQSGPLSGANVVERDANQRIVNVVTTDENGHFTLHLKNPADELMVSYVGFNPYKSPMNQKNFDVRMTPSTAMDAISVTGYASSHPTTAASQKKALVASSGVFDITEQMPSFPGGNSAWMQYLSSHIHYPVAALVSRVQAEMIITFIVDKNGYIRSPKVTQVSAAANSLDKKTVSAAKNGDAVAKEQMDAYIDGMEALKDEAVSILRNSPQWIPAQQNGTPVNCQYSIPINFTMK